MSSIIDGGANHPFQVMLPACVALNSLHDGKLPDFDLEVTRAILESFTSSYLSHSSTNFWWKAKLYLILFNKLVHVKMATEKFWR